MPEKPLSDLIDRKQISARIADQSYLWDDYDIDQVLGDIEDAPAVEAIPVEWIEKFGKENFYDWDTELNVISVMLDAWRKENYNCCNNRLV